MTNSTKSPTEVECSIGTESATATCKLTGLSGGAIAGIVIGVIVCLVIIAVIVFFIKRRWDDEETSDEEREITSLTRHVCCCSHVQNVHGHGPNGHDQQSCPKQTITTTAGRALVPVEPKRTPAQLEPSEVSVLHLNNNPDPRSVLSIAYVNQMMAGEGVIERERFQEERRGADGRVKVMKQEEARFCGRHDGDDVVAVFAKQKTYYETHTAVPTMAAITGGDN